MSGLAVLVIHLIATLARLLGPGGVRSLVAESLLLKHQLLIVNRSRQRSPKQQGRNMIGEAAHLGKELEAKPLIYSAIYKAFMYGLLVFAFHVVEEVVTRLVHGKDIAGAFHEMRLDDLLARSVVIFCTFIPFFGFRELGRSMGKGKFRALVFGTGTAKSDS